MDDVSIIDDMSMLAIGAGAAARQRHELCTADEDVKAIVVEPHAQAVTDQSGRNGVEHLAQGEATRGGAHCLA